MVIFHSYVKLPEGTFGSGSFPGPGCEVRPEAAMSAPEFSKHGLQSLCITAPMFVVAFPGYLRMLRKAEVPKPLLFFGLFTFKA